MHESPLYRSYDGSRTLFGCRFESDYTSRFRSSVSGYETAFEICGNERTGDLQLRGTAAAGFPADSGTGRTAVVWRCLRAAANLCRHRKNHFRRKAGLGTGLYRTALRRHLCCCAAFFPDCCIGAGADNIGSPANGCSPSFSDSDAAVHGAAGLSGGTEATAISVQKKECRVNMRCCPKKHCIKIFSKSLDFLDRTYYNKRV